MRFWDWAVQAYAGAGVAAACLSLQDEDGQNVPLLLWAAWLSGLGITVGEPQALEAVVLTRSWSDTLISPLRLLRRRLKAELSTGDEALRLPLREKIKVIELEAEQALMEALSALEVARNASINQNVKADLFASLKAVSYAWNKEMPESALLRLSEALSEGGFLQYKGQEGATLRSPFVL